jgi:hypothetical protein
VSCSAIAHNNPDIYNSTCSLTFQISSYNETQKYYIYPTLSYGLTYNNGSQVISSTLSKEFATITVDRHWCGDGVCNPDEDYSACCFDCACPSDQYCDTQITGSYTTGDSCKLLGPVSVSVVPPTQTAFSDTMFTHVLEIGAHVMNAPSDAELMPRCSFADDDPSIECEAECSGIDNTGYSLCSITIPSIEYSNSPYFSAANNWVLLADNVLNLSIVFSDGPSMLSKSSSFDVPDLTINVTYHCGIGGCESHLGETTDNCCIDCGCTDPDEYCYTGGWLAGQCLDSNELYLIFDDTFPKPMECTIQQVDGDCIFTRSLGIKAHIPNPPDDLEIVASWYDSRSKTWNANCLELEGKGNYSCSVILENIDDPTEGDQELEATLGFTASYTINGTKTVQNLTAPFAVGIKRVKSDYVKSCEERINKLDKQISKLEKNKKLVETILYVLIVLTIIACVCCAVPWCGWACKWCEPGICITSCVSVVLLPMMSDIESKMEGIKTQRESTCATTNYGGLSSANADSFDSGNLYMALVGAIICMICALTDFGSGAVFNNAGGPGYPAGDPNPAMANLA